MKLPVELQRPLAKLIAHSWIDSDFRNRLFREPATVLQETGWCLQDFATITANQESGVLAFAEVEGGAVSYEIEIPSKPTGLEDELISSWNRESPSWFGEIRGCSCT